jgi:hypothetical protein
MEITLYAQPETKPDGFQFTQQKIAEFFFVNVAQSEEEPVTIFLFLGLGRVPRTGATRIEELHEHRHDVLGFAGVERILLQVLNDGGS